MGHSSGTYGAIISVYSGADEAITALTDHGVEEMTDMLSEARLTTKACHQFLDDFIHDPELRASGGRRRAARR